MLWEHKGLNDSNCIFARCKYCWLAYSSNHNLNDKFYFFFFLSKSFFILMSIYGDYKVLCECFENFHFHELVEYVFLYLCPTS